MIARRKMIGPQPRLLYRPIHVLCSFEHTVAPIIGMTTVMLECEDAKLVGQNSVVDSVRKPGDQAAPNVCLKEALTLRRIMNDANGALHGAKKLRS